MKKRIISIVISMIALMIVVVSLTFTFAWYTNTDDVGKFDATASDLAIYYAVDDKDINVSEYSITNLTFFDIDDPKELKYFNSMHTVIKLDIKNLSPSDITYTITFESEIVSTTSEADASTILSRAYVAGFISDNSAITIADDNTNSILTYLPENKNATTNLNTYKTVWEEDLIGSGEAPLYLHVLGVQDTDSATNEFLFDSGGKAKAYHFTIKIEAVGKKTDTTEGEVQ